MDNSTDLTTRELSTLRLQLADDLVFAPQTHGKEIFYHVEAPSQGRFFRIGYSEYAFLSLFDGDISVAQALTVTARNLGTDALTQAQGMQVASWLLEHGLARVVDSDSRWTSPPESTNSKIVEGWNPFWLKIRLGSPDRWLSALAPITGWLFSPLATIAGLVVILLGVASVATHWAEFAASARTVFQPTNWLWMAVAWIVLKLVHEAAHGLACKHYRGEVRETGLIFILFAPMAYVDVTSCWRFPSKWQRIHVAGAGMFFELVLAAIAALIWVRVDSTATQYLLYNVIVMASLSTLLFNANPLMRFDGYYILADLLEIPNLAADGQRFLHDLTRRVFYGTTIRPLEVLGFRKWCVRGYGLAAAAWRLLVCASLITSASVLLEGAGLLLALLGVLGWFGPPIWQTICDLRRRLLEARPSFVRAMVVGTFAAAALTGALLWVPWPGGLTAPVVVEYADLSVVRCRAAGFVESVHVADGQEVAAGQLLVQLRNDELTAEERELELALQQQRVRQRIALDQQDAGQAQIALGNLQAIEQRLVEVRRRTRYLEVRAPVPGRVVARTLEHSVGSYISEGTEILAVGDEARKELIISVSQQQLDAILPRVGETSRFRIDGRRARHGVFARLEQHASHQLPHPAMSSLVGGPLAVTEASLDESSRSRLAEPRFRGIISVAPEACRDLGAGEQGYALLGPAQEKIGQFLWVRFYRWFESLLRPAKA